MPPVSRSAQESNELKTPDQTYEEYLRKIFDHQLTKFLKARRLKKPDNAANLVKDGKSV